ncbi:Replication protein C (RepC) [Burkholderia multivorans]
MTLRTQDKRIVRYDPMLPSSGLFGSLGNGERPKLDIKYAFGGIVWRLRGPDRLGIPEQTLMLVLLELAQEQYGQAQQQIDDWTPIETALYCEPDARPLASFRDGSPPALATLHVSYAELSQRCGRTAEGGSAAKQIRRELMRLSEVTIWAVVGNQEYSSRLLHWRRGDGHGAQVILNARLTEIIIGQQYSPVSLQERLVLKSDVARALHCALSVRIRPGKTMSFNLDTLAPYVWCEHDVADATVRRRRQQLRAALCEIHGLHGWSIRTRSGEPLEQAESVNIFRKATTAARLRSRPARRKPAVKQLPSSVASPGGRKSQTIADVSSIFA